MVEDIIKGSESKILQLMNEDKYKDTLKELFGQNITWICPERDNKSVFHEHQLTNKNVVKRLKLKKDAWKDFWPTRQPTWDGIIINENVEGSFDTVYLIEAKSHLTESLRRYSRGKELNEQQRKNDKMILQSIQNVAWTSYGIKIKQDNKYWLKTYFQVANRLAFHQKLKDNLEGKTVRLIFLIFLNDPTWKEGKTQTDWDKKFDTIFEEMGLNRNILKKQGVDIKYVDASSYEDCIKKKHYSHNLK